jgi:L-aminopeptidase/D-esterase-like protein
MKMNPLFDATVQAVEEVIINALVAAETITRSSRCLAMDCARF